MVGLGVPDGPHQAVMRDHQRPRRQLTTKRRPNISRGQLPQRPGPDPFRQRFTL
jgi:hypothetical protein